MDADTAKGKHKEAVAACKNEDYLQSLLLLDEINFAFPDRPDILYLMAVCHARLGQRSDALDLCSRLSYVYQDPRAEKLALELNPQVQDHEEASFLASLGFTMRDWLDSLLEGLNRLSSASFSIGRGTLLIIGVIVFPIGIYLIGAFAGPGRGSATDGNTTRPAVQMEADEATAEFMRWARSTKGGHVVSSEYTSQGGMLSKTDNWDNPPYLPPNKLASMLDSSTHPDWVCKAAAIALKHQGKIDMVKTYNPLVHYELFVKGK